MNKTSQQVYEMGEIKGCPIWVIISEKTKDNITMRVRSRVIPVDEICERFGGGGHKNACGIKVENRSKVKDILIALDKEIADYRKQHGNLLENFQPENDRISKFNKEYKNIANSFGFAFNIPRNLDPSFSLLKESPMKLKERIRDLTGDEITFLEEKQIDEKKNVIAMVFNESAIQPYSFYTKINNEWYCKDKVGSAVRHISESEINEIFNKSSKSPYFMNIKKTLVESINVKREYDGKTLEVELDADIDLNDGKTHFIKSKDLVLKLTKKGTVLDLEVDVESDVKNENDKNIEIYNKKLPFDIKRARRAGIPENITDVLYKALSDLSEKQIGALIAIENDTNLNRYCENGEKINCPISEEIFMSIFYPGTDVHDGATIIKDGVIKYTSVFFKNISGDNFAERYGARHRAAMGLSKETDAFCIVVSEESGNISFAIDGKLHVIKANDVKKSKNRFIKLFNENKKEGRD